MPMEQQQVSAEKMENEINLLEIMMVLVKRKRLIIAITLVASLASIGYSLSLPNIYTATVKVLPPQKEGGNLSSVLGQLGGLAGIAGISSGFGGTADLYVSLLKSRTVADAVIKQLDLAKEFKSKTADEARSKYASVVLVRPVSKDGIITITASHQKPEFAVKLVNVTVEELGRRSVQLNLAKFSNDRIFLEQRLDVVKKDLKKAEEDMKSFAQLNKAIKVDEQAKATIDGVARIKAELASKEVLLAAIRSYQTDESPEVKSLLAASGTLKRELGTLEGNSGHVREGIPSLGNVPSLALEYTRRLREVKTQEAILEQLTKQYEMAKISENRDTTSLQVFDDAVIPDIKSGPKRSIIVLLATVTSFFFASFLAFIMDYAERLPCHKREMLLSMKRLLLPFSRVKKL
jgi:tyrosine-protein kinase Etk/Wzc